MSGALWRRPHWGAWSQVVSDLAPRSRSLVEVTAASGVPTCMTTTEAARSTDRSSRLPRLHEHRQDARPVAVPACNRRRRSHSGCVHVGFRGGGWLWRANDATGRRRTDQQVEQVPDSAARVCDYLTSERRRESSPTTRGRTIQIIVVEPSIAHSLTVFVAPLRSATCV